MAEEKEDKVTTANVSLGSLSGQLLATLLIDTKCTGQALLHEVLKKKLWEATSMFRVQLCHGDQIIKPSLTLQDQGVADGSTITIVHESCSTVVIHSGSSTCRAGFAGAGAPSAVFATMVGRPKVLCLDGLHGDPPVVGEEAQIQRGILSLRYPIENGLVTSWDDMEAIWHHIFFNELRIAPEEHAVLLAEAPLTPKASREHVVSIMFETFNVRSLYVASEAVLSLYGSGLCTGVVLDSGETVSRCVPVYEGHALPQAISSLSIGGREVSEYLSRLLSESNDRMMNFDGHFIDPSQKSDLGRFDLVRHVKENFCYVVLDFEADVKIAAKKTYELPRTWLNLPSTMTLGNLRFLCPEVVFRPELIGMDDTGVHTKVFESIRKCDVDIRKLLYESIVLSGGNTMFAGFADRLTKELLSLTPSGTKVHVLAPPERKASAWFGGSCLPSLTTFDQMCISAAEYDDRGPNLVHIKCF